MSPDRDAFGNEIGGTAASGSSVRRGPTPARMPTAPAAAPPSPSGPMTRSGLAPAAPTSGSAMAAFVLGVVGLWFWPVAPFAWHRGKRTVSEIDASMGAVGGRGLAQTGLVLGRVGTFILIAVIVFGGIGAATGGK